MGRLRVWLGASTARVQRVYTGPGTLILAGGQPSATDAHRLARLVQALGAGQDHIGAGLQPGAQAGLGPLSPGQEGVHRQRGEDPSQLVGVGIVREVPLRPGRVEGNQQTVVDSPASRDGTGDATRVEARDGALDRGRRYRFGPAGQGRQELADQREARRGRRPRRAPPLRKVPPRFPTPAPAGCLPCGRSESRTCPW